jgi:nucleotide-binding universal stress UspA family protein
MVLRGGDVRCILVDLSEREDSDLIVMSAHGSTCNRALSFGSIATYLLLHSVVSVLVLQDLPEPAAGDQDTSRSAPPPRASFAESV